MATLQLLLQKQVTALADIRMSIDVHLKMIAGAVRGLVATNERLRKQYCQQCEVQKTDIGMQLVHFILSLYTGWAKKTGLFSDLITL